MVSGLHAVGVPRSSGPRRPQHAWPGVPQHGLSPWAGGRGSPRDNDKPPQSFISRKRALFFLLVGTNGQTLIFFIFFFPSRFIYLVFLYDSCRNETSAETLKDLGFFRQ